MQGWGLLKEVWSPYTGGDYAEVFKQRHHGDSEKAAKLLSSHQNGKHTNGFAP